MKNDNELLQSTEDDTDKTFKQSPLGTVEADAIPYRQGIGIEGAWEFATIKDVLFKKKVFIQFITGFYDITDNHVASILLSFLVKISIDCKSNPLDHLAKFIASNTRITEEHQKYYFNILKKRGFISSEPFHCHSGRRVTVHFDTIIMALRAKTDEKVKPVTMEKEEKKRYFTALITSLHSLSWNEIVANMDSLDMLATQILHYYCMGYRNKYGNNAPLNSKDVSEINKWAKLSHEKFDFHYLADYFKDENVHHHSIESFQKYVWAHQKEKSGTTIGETKNELDAFFWSEGLFMEPIAVEEEYSGLQEATEPENVFRNAKHTHDDKAGINDDDDCPIRQISPDSMI